MNNKFIISIFLFSLLVHFISQNNYISPGIDGENIVGAFYLIPIHTPGYPLYSIISKLFAYLPFGNYGFRVIFASAVFISLTSVIIFIIMLKILYPKNLSNFNIYFSSFITVLLFNFSPTFLLHSITASVYSIFSFLISLQILLIINILQDNKTSSFKECSILYFLLGILFSYHPQIAIIIFLPLVYFSIVKNTVLHFFKFAFLFLLGFCITIFLPLRTTEIQSLILSYAENWQDFIKCFAKEEFSSYIKILNIKEYLLTILFFFYHLIKQATMFFIFFAITGLSIFDRKLLKFLILLFTFNIFIFAFFLKVPIEEYVYFERIWIPAFIIYFIFIGAGISKVISKFPTKYSVIVTLLLLFLFNSCIRHYFEIKKTTVITPSAYGKKNLSYMDKNSILFVNDVGFYYCLLYLQHVENIRKDISVVCCNYLPYYSYQKELQINQKIYVYLTDKEKKAPYCLRWGFYNWEVMLNLCNRIAQNNISNRPLYFIRDTIFEDIRIYKLQKLEKLYQCQSKESCLPMIKYKGKISNKKLNIYNIFKKVISL